LRKACIKLKDKVELIVVGIKRKNEINIKYYDWVSQKKLNEFYNNSDLCVFPSLYETFGNVVLESLACNTPIIVGENVVAGVILKDYLVMTKKDSDSIKKVIEEAIKNCNNLKKKTKAGCLYVRKYFSDQKVLNSEIMEILKYKKYFGNYNTKSYI